MQFESSDWLNHYYILAIILCSPNMSTVRVCSKLKTRWKSVVFTNKVGKNFRYFRGVFNKTVIPLALVGYEIIIANHCLTHTRGIIASYKLLCQFEYMLNHVPYSVLRAFCVFSNLIASIWTRANMPNAGDFSWSWILKGFYSGSKRGRKICRGMFTPSIKRQIRRFHVVVVHWTSKKCTKKRDARAELLFWSLNLLFFSKSSLWSSSWLLKLPNVFVGGCFA